MSSVKNVASTDTTAKQDSVKAQRDEQLLKLVQKLQHQRDALKQALKNNKQGNHTLAAKPGKNAAAKPGKSAAAKPTKNAAAAKNFTQVSKDARTSVGRFAQLRNKPLVKSADDGGSSEVDAPVAAPLAIASVVVVCACVAAFAVIRRRQRNINTGEAYSTLA